MKRSNKKTVIIFGFSGSGKTIIANRLGKRFGLKVVHPSGILRNICLGNNPISTKTISNRGFWESEKGRKILKGRLKDNVPPDILSDKIILAEAKKGNVVIDSWSLPWLYSGGIKIYLMAPLRIRAARVAKRSRFSFSKAQKIVAEKDSDTRRLFKRIYGFDIARDINVFDLKIDTTNLTRDQIEKMVTQFLLKE